MDKRRTFGPAREFYRIRFMCIFEVSPEELGWEEGTGIYREIETPPVEQKTNFEIQIINLDSSNIIKKLVFKDGGEARLKYRSIVDDLNKMEKGEFDTRYNIPS